MEPGNFFRDFIAPVIQWMVLIAGWKYVSSDNNKREQRKEIRNHLNNIIEIIYCVKNDAFHYYSSDPQNNESTLLELSIKEKLDRIEKSIDIISSQLPKFKEKSALIKLRQIVTGNSMFESQGRQVLPPRDKLHYEISLGVRNLINDLEVNYISSYSKNAKSIDK